jgi:hypothetical protein
MTITTVDHVTKGVDRLSYKLKQDNVEKLLTLFLEKSQEIEDSFIELANQKSIDIAEGVWLDYIGKILATPRGGLSDEAYRVELKFKISINTADGTPNVIIDLIKQFTESVSVRITESGTAFATLTLDGQTNIGTELWKLLQEIRPTATRFIIHSDLLDSAFVLPYEDNVYKVEVFQTTSDGILFEDFEVTTDGVNYRQFFSITEEKNYYEPTIDADKNSLFYEDSFNLYLTSDGSSYEPFVNSNVEDFRVVVPYNEYYVPYGLLPMHWEVGEDSSTLDAELETLFIEAGLLEYYANITLPSHLN